MIPIRPSSPFAVPWRRSAHANSGGSVSDPIPSGLTSPPETPNDPNHLGEVEDPALCPPESPLTALSQPQISEVPPPPPPHSPEDYRIKPGNRSHPHQYHASNNALLSPPEEIRSPPHFESSPNSDVLNPTTACIVCKRRNTDGKHDFCGDECEQSVTSQVPLLLHVPPEHHAFRKVQKVFQAGWPRNYRSRTVDTVYRIVCPSNFRQQFSNYCTGLQLHPLQPKLNLQMHWAAARPCELMHSPNNIGFCQTNSCELCNYLRPSNAPEFLTVFSHADTAFHFSTPSGRRYVDVLCVAAMGRVFEHGSEADPLQCNSTVKRKFLSDRFSIKLPRQAVLPAYLVYFE